MMMTRDEILAQAKVGGFAIVRIPLNADMPCDTDGSQIFAFDCDNDPVCFSAEKVISIEPLPETLEQENARLKARIAELEALHLGDASPLPKNSQTIVEILEAQK
jgi:hypothetical protein